MVRVLAVLALVSLYFVVEGNTDLGNYFMLLAILVSTVSDRLGNKKRKSARTNSSRKKKVEENKQME